MMTVLLAALLGWCVPVPVGLLVGLLAPRERDMASGEDPTSKPLSPLSCASFCMMVPVQGFDVHPCVLAAAVHGFPPAHCMARRDGG